MPGVNFSEAQLNLVRKHLGAQVRDWLSKGELAEVSIESMSKDDHAELHDAVLSALIEDGPVVRSFTAEQDKGPYPVCIVGIDGVYLLLASEYDTLGPFTTLDESMTVMERNYGPFLIGR